MACDRLKPAGHASGMEAQSLQDFVELVAFELIAPDEHPVNQQAPRGVVGA